MLARVNVDDAILKCIPILFEKAVQKEQRKQMLLIQDQKKRIQDLIIKQKQIEDSLIRTSIPLLHEKLEKEWTSINVEKAELEETINN